MLHNLLQPEQRKGLVREYYARVAAVGAIVLSVALLIGMLALIPAYSYSRTMLEVQAVVPAQTSTSTATSSPDGAARTALREGTMLVTRLEQHLRDDTFTSYLTSALADRPPGVAVSGFAYDQAEHSLTVEGVAQDRDAFLTYAHNLESDTRFVGVPHPIEDLAKRTDLPFRLTFTVQSVSTTP
jgi:hypothetical protein